MVVKNTKSPRSIFLSRLAILFYLTLFVLLIGTIFYSYLEGWGWLDSLYFSVTTLTAVGYGDMYPTTPISKLFTVFYLFLGMGIILAFIRVIFKMGEE